MTVRTGRQRHSARLSPFELHCPLNAVSTSPETGVAAAARALLASVQAQIADRETMTQRTVQLAVLVAVLLLVLAQRYLF